mmetsp:Transcript_9522/g.14296  ORF Transcript_9522/g.14296 Transcript_9522/m.14296 type:complete len:325 (+) Transcript_9522:166-1140(+)
MAAHRLQRLQQLGAAAAALGTASIALWRLWTRLVTTKIEKDVSDIVLIKFGGAALTVKDKFETVDEKSMLKATQLLGQQYRAGKKMAVVIGAGSFGHFQAKKYGLSKGISAHKDYRKGCAECRTSVQRLCHIFTNLLVKEGVPAVGISPFPSARAQSKILVEDGPLATVKYQIIKGYVPIIHGDVIFDDVQGHCILSGDTIIQRLCSLLRPKTVAFITDVPGIFDRPPSSPEAKLISRIGVASNGEIELKLETSKAEHDVTGGIKGKLACASSIVAAHNVGVFIGGVDSEATSRVLLGIDNYGSKSLDEYSNLTGTWLVPASTI